mgnify:FL=1
MIKANRLIRDLISQKRFMHLNTGISYAQQSIVLTPWTTQWYFSNKLLERAKFFYCIVLWILIHSRPPIISQFFAMYCDKNYYDYDKLLWLKVLHDRILMICFSVKFELGLNNYHFIHCLFFLLAQFENINCVSVLSHTVIHINTHRL